VDIRQKSKWFTIKKSLFCCIIEKQIVSLLKNFMKNIDRRLDLSAKFIQMGQSLMEEGQENKDSGVGLLGTILIFIGGIALDDDDVYKFSDLVSMFSAKKMLDNMEAEQNPVMDLIKKASNNETYEGFVDKIQNLRKVNKERKNKKDDDDKKE
jgi:hypothetical protein